MSLYLVVRHRRDPDQAWANDWIDDERLRAITTTSQIGALCAKAKAGKERILVHRCASAASPATICCSVEVARVDRVDATTSLVTVEAPQIVGMPPTVSPSQGTNCYLA